MTGKSSSGETDPRLHAVREALRATRVSNDTPPPAASGPDWALAPDASRVLVALIERLAPRHVVEFGSGRSTLTLARACAALPERGLVSTIENDPVFADQVRSSLADEPVGDVVRVVLAPLGVSRVGGRHSPVYRFAADDLATADAPGIVLVDGPPAALGGRLGSVTQAIELVAADGIVLLDDAARPEEQLVLARVRESSSRRCSVTFLSELERGLGVILPNSEQT